MALLTGGSFIVTPAILSGLGDAAYGGWLLINSFISYMRLLDLGTSAGTVKYGAGALERGDEADLARVFNTTQAIFLSVALLSLIGTLALMGILPRVYPVTAGETLTILTLGAAMAIDLCMRTFAAALRSRSLFFVYDSIEIVAYVIFKLGLVLYFASRHELSYRVLSTLTLGETIVRNTLVMGLSFALCPYVRRVNPLRAERTMFRKLAAIGGVMSVIQIADIVRFQIDSAVIGFFMPDSPQSISIFGIGTRLPSIAFSAIGTIGAVLMPKFSGLSETGDKKSIAKLLDRASLATGLLAALVLVNLAVIGPHFLELWLKKPWIPTSGWIMRILLPAYFVSLLTGPSAGLLVGRGQPRGLMLVTVGEAAANFVLSVALVHWLGIFGVALGTAVPMLVARGIVFPIVMKNTVGLEIKDYWRMHARSLIVAGVYLVLTVGLAFVPMKTYGAFFLQCLVSVAVFLVIVLVGVPEARAAVPKLLDKLPGRRRKAAED